MKFKLLLLLVLFSSVSVFSQTTFNFPPNTISANKELSTNNTINEPIVKNGVTFKKNTNKSTTTNKTLTTTTIPNTNFEQALIDLGIDSDGIINQQILTSDAEAVLELDVHSKFITDLTGIEAFTSLTLLYCWDNQLTSLDVTKLTALEKFSCSRNQLTDLDITQNTALTNLSCSQNGLTNLDVTQNTALVKIWCDYNQLSNLDVSKNLELFEINCLSNDLTTIDVSANTKIFTLWCQNNQLTSINLGVNTILRYFDCSFNQLTNLDLSQTPTISQLDCNDNLLTSLELTNNTNLWFVKCQANSISSINTSNNSLLHTLWCFENQLTNLDVTQNTAMNILSCGDNLLTNLDVTQNTALTELWCYQNQLTILNTNLNTALKYIIAWDNKITNFDVSLNTALELFQPGQNPITSLDLSQNIVLSGLWAAKTDLESLNIANGNNTKMLNTSYLDEFEVGRNPNLYCVQVDDAAWSTSNWTNIDSYTDFSIDCSGDDDTDGVINSDDKCANTPNGESVDADGCSYDQINADDDGDGVINTNDICANTPNGNTVNADGCSVVAIPDANFEQALIDLGYDTDGVINQQILLSDAHSITNLNVSSKNISDLTGLNYFINLSVLQCYQNQLNSLDVSKNTSLTQLFFNSNNITDIDITQNTLLQFLQFGGNKISSLDTSNNTSLSYLVCDNNEITSLDLSTNINLVSFQCYNNLLENLNIKNGNNSKIAPNVFNTTNNPNLTCIQVDNATYSTTNWTNIDSQTSFNEDCGDDDNDGILNTTDLCANTPNGETVNSDGCSESQLDDDNDGVMNNADLCADTPNGETVNSDGCSNGQLDDDDDGVMNSVDLCANTPNGSVVNTLGCILLTADNFNIETIGETCVGKNNGQLIITTQASYNYTATIDGTDYNFTSNLTIDNLSAGEYTICITLSEEATFEQCFILVVEQAAAITGKSTSSKINGVTSESIQVTSGTAPYRISINGEEVLKSNSKSFTVEVNHGDHLSVNSKFACEGTFEKTINLSDEFLLYPNPTTNYTEVFIPNTDLKEVTVVIYNLQQQLISRKTYRIEHSRIRLSLKDKPTGIYFIELELNAPVSLKIIKQ